ncbi:MAG: DoxX family protein [Deltaproteobacteria bacterium]|nr:DoxX family protein [Deltaproteobacteria bacterium]
MRSRLAAVVGPFALLPVRLAVGLAGILHGWPLVGQTPEVTRTLAQAGLPWPGGLAWLGAGSLLVGGILVLVGFLTRLAALAIVCTAGLVAFRLRFANGCFGDQGFEGPLLLALAALTLVLGGPGRASIDAFRGRA